eukprot:14192750-Alexandrium_andersonii.AAC.1
MAWQSPFATVVPRLFAKLLFQPTTAPSVQSLLSEADQLAKDLFSTWGQTKVVEDLFQASRDREDRQ